MNIKRKFDSSTHQRHHGSERTGSNEPFSKYARLNGSQNHDLTESETKVLCLTKRPSQSYGFNCTFEGKFPEVADIIKGSSADTAGLKINDCIHKINGVGVSMISANKFIDTIRRQGDTINLLVSNKKEKTSKHGAHNGDSTSHKARLCTMHYNPDPSNSGYGFYVLQKNNYVIIAEIQAQSSAEMAGLKVNDRVISVNRKSTVNMTQAEVCDLIKTNQFVAELLVVDNSAHLYFQKNGIKIHEKMVNLKKFESPIYDLPRAKLCKLNLLPGFSGYGFDIWLADDNKSHVVHIVNPDSPAEISSVKPNDCLIEINGINCEHLNLESIIQLIKGHPEKVDLLLVDGIAREFFSAHGIAINKKMLLLDEHIQPSIIKKENISTFEARLCVVRKDLNFDGYGFHISSINKTEAHYISKVQKSSPAEKAKIVNNDRIVEVNGIKAQNLTLEDVTNLIKEFPSFVELLLVDEASDRYFQINSIEVTSTMEELSHYDSMNKKPETAEKCLRKCLIHLTEGSNEFGFEISGMKEKFYITSVAPSSPAFLTKVKKNDRILEVNGINLEGFLLNNVLQLVKQYQTKVELLLVDKDSEKYFISRDSPLNSSNKNIKIHETRLKNDEILPLMGSHSGRNGDVKSSKDDTVIKPLLESKGNGSFLMNSDISSLINEETVAPLLSISGLLENGSMLSESNFSGKPSVYRCNVRKRPNYFGYGFTVQQSLDMRRVYIEKVLENSPADLDGLKPLSTILEINGQSIEGLSVQEIISVVKSSEGSVMLLLADAEEINQNGSLDDVTEIILKSSYAGYGFSLKITNSQVLITSVVPNSPADLGGILPNDRLLKVNNQNVNNLNFNEITELVKEYEDEVKLSIKKSTILDDIHVSQDILPQDMLEIVVPKHQDGYGFTLKPNLDGSGVYIYQVISNTPAEKCGLKSMDKVVKVNGLDVEHSTFEEVIELIKLYNDSVQIIVNRSNQNLLLDYNDDAHNLYSLYKHVHEVIVKKLPSQSSYGFTLHPHRDTGIFYISSITETSPAKISGLQLHDSVIEINGYSIDGFSIVEVIELVQMYSDQVVLIVADPPSDLSYNEEPVFFASDSSYDKIYANYCGFHKCNIAKSSRQIGFGFTLNEISGNKDALFVTSVQQNSPAEKHGLQEFEHVLEVNGCRVSEMSFPQVIELIKAQNYQITLILGQPLAHNDAVDGGEHGFMRDILPDFINNAKMKPISNFVLDVIDKIFALEYEEFARNEDKSLRSALIKGNYVLAKGYSNDELNKKTSTDFIDFDIHEIRIAYVIRFFVTHAYAITDHMANACGTIKMPAGRKIKISVKPMVSWVQQIKMKKSIKIVCFGGGPGSDVLGLIDYLNEVPVNCRIQLTMFDKFLYWESTIRKMVSILTQNGVIIDFQFVVVDFLVPSDIMNVINYVRDADVITMSKFVSAIQAYDKETRYGLSLVFYNMAPGSIVFFLDNSGGGSHQMFSGIADACDLLQFYNFIHTYKLPDGAIDHFRKYKKNYDLQPSKQLAIAVMMYIKPDNKSMKEQKRKYF